MRLKMLVMAGMAIVTGTLHAQQAWTLDQILQSALSSHPAMLGKRSAQQAAQAERAGAEWQRYPSPSLESSNDTEGESANVLRIDQPLWAGGRISATIAAAESRADAAAAAIGEVQLDLTLKVIAAGIEGLRQQQRLQHARKNVDEHHKLLEMIQRRVAQAVSPQTDLRLAQSRLYQAESELSATRQALASALAQLTQLAGSPVTEVAWPGLAEPEHPPPLEDAMAQALDHSALLRRLAYEENAASAEITMRRAAYSPQLTMRMEKRSGAIDDERVMLVFQAQPGAGLSAAAGVDAAIARRDALRLEKAAAVRGVRERVTLDWNEWEAAGARLKVAFEVSAMSDEVFASYVRQYAVGRKTWIEVLNAVREATQSRLALEDTRAQAIAASLRLRAQTGALHRQDSLALNIKNDIFGSLDETRHSPAD